MYEVLEEWIPIANFEKEYPDLKIDYFLKINHLIIIYRIVRNDDPPKHTQCKSSDIFFSLEDAWEAVKNRYK